MTKKKIYRAGFVPYIVENGKVMMLFMKPSEAKFGGDVWQIAKGKIDPGESSEDAAVREAKEELGLFPPNIDGHAKFLGQFLGRTDMYVGKMKEKEMFGDYTFETGAVKWMSPDEFQKIGRDIHKPVIKAASRYVIRKEDIKE
jgi:8-oxo-dGTP pyrophosphatase MutT (NUDIX family)